MALHDVADLIAMPISDRPQAEAFIDALVAAGLGYHFDDGPVDCLHGNGLVTLADAEAISDQVDACYTAWEASGVDMQRDCPIGHMIVALERAEVI